MGKRGWLIFGAIWLVISGSLIALVYYTTWKPQTEARNEFIDRWSAAYQRGKTASENLADLTEDLNLLMNKSVRPPQEFDRAIMLVTVSDENLTYALECFKKIDDRFDGSTVNLDGVNDLLSLTEKPLKRAEELNKLLEEEIQELRNSEPPK